MATVSVVTPTYNRERVLPRAVDSVLGQTGTDFEYLVVDDASTDDTESVMAAYTDDRLQYIRLDTNAGANAARNVGIDEASGEYIAFLDSDDEWEPNKLERQLHVAENEDVGAVYTGVSQFVDGELTAEKTPSLAGDITADLLGRNFIGTFSSVLVSTPVARDVGRLDESMPSWQDWDYYLRLSRHTDFGVVEEALTRQHGHDGPNISSHYETKRDESAPKLLEKHAELADRHGVKSNFQATIAAELGWSAVSQGRYREARSHFLRSYRHNASTERLLLFGLTAGGRFTYKPAQWFKRNALRGFKFKSDTV